MRRSYKHRRKDEEDVEVTDEDTGWRSVER